jgi:hypothetical protein
MTLFFIALRAGAASKRRSGRVSQFSSTKLTDKGRTFASRITEANVSTKTFDDAETGTSRDATQLTVRFDRPDGKYELEFYRINEESGEGKVSKRSDLGKLIEYFKKMGINDMGENDFEPIIGGYFWVETFPRQNRRTGEPNDKRFPVRKMTADEIEEHFGQGAAGASKPSLDKDAIFGSIKDAVLGAVDGLTKKALFSKLATIPSIAQHAQASAIFEEASKGNLVKWLEEGNYIKIENDTIHVLGNGTASAATPAEPETASA